MPQVPVGFFFDFVQVIVLCYLHVFYFTDFVLLFFVEMLVQRYIFDSYNDAVNNDKYYVMIRCHQHRCTSDIYV